MILQMSKPTGSKANVGSGQATGKDQVAMPSGSGYDVHGGSQSTFESEKEKFYKRELESLKRKNQKLEHQVAENEAKKLKKDEFQDYLMDGESMVNSVQRRLRYQRRNPTYKINQTIKNIISEAQGKLTEDIKEIMMKISGQNWPDEIKACHDFNTGNAFLN